MDQLLPQSPTALGKPGIQLFEAMESIVAGGQPDAASTVLDILFDDTFFPSRTLRCRSPGRTGSDHHEASIDRAAFTLGDPVDRRFHVVVDAATRHAAQGGE